MNKFNLIAVAIGLLSLLGFFAAKRDGSLAVPDAIKIIQCPNNSKEQEFDVFNLMGTTLAIPCSSYGNGKAMAKSWKTEEEKDPTHKYTSAFKYFDYFFRKKPDGHFDAAPEANDPIPSARDTRYAVQATISSISPGPLQEKYFDRHWEMSVPTPLAFAATGSETTFWCHGPKQHYEMSNECVARVQSKNLFWTVGITFGRPTEDDFDMRPEIIEAYQLLASHVIKQE